MNEERLKRAANEIDSPESKRQIGGVLENSNEIGVSPNFILTSCVEKIMSEVENSNEKAEELEKAKGRWLHKIKIKTMQEHSFDEIKANQNRLERE